MPRVFDGVCYGIVWTEFQAWAALNGHIVRPAEYGVLRAMDIAFCDEINKDLQAQQSRFADGGKGNAPPAAK